MCLMARNIDGLVFTRSLRDEGLNYQDEGLQKVRSHDFRDISMSHFAS
jgi:hypothetical protein